jgi:nitrate/nitrite transporter NarK
MTITKLSTLDFHTPVLITFICFIIWIIAMSIGISLGHYLYFSLKEVHFFAELPKVSTLYFIKINSSLLIIIFAYKIYDYNK